MSFDIPLLQLTAKDGEGKIKQIQAYLFKLSEQLTYALNTIERESETEDNSLEKTKSQTGSEEAVDTFNEIKTLIIKSADIINAYSEEINKRLEGQYVAYSEFGEYQRTTSQEINVNSQTIESFYTDLQNVISSVTNLESQTVATNAYIRSGLLEDGGEGGIPIYGLEVGQTSTVDGQDVFKKFARFTSDELSFYDRNESKVAYISDYKLYITNAEITGTLKLGGFIFDTSNGIACKWV